MRKKLLMLTASIVVACTMVACSNTSSGEITESTENIVAAETNNESIVDFTKYDFDYADYVTLPDYDAIPVELSSNYETTDDMVHAYIEEWFEASGPFYTDDDVKTVVSKDDIVNIDYVGKLNGEQFDGGAASNQVVDVSNNCSVSGNSYIDGFTQCLIGATVGESVEGNVIFPADYENETLAGQEVVFTFTINSIQREIAFEEIDDTFAKNYAGTNSVDEMYSIVTEALQEENAYHKSQEISYNVQQYLLDNCEVNIPDDYFNDVFTAYRHSFIQTNCDGDESCLEEVLTSEYGYTVDEADAEWRDMLLELTKLDFILGTIAEEMSIELDTDGYNAKLNEIVEHYELASVEELFASYGYGDIAYGEQRVKEIYIQDKVLAILSENAVISIPETTEE